MGLLHKTTYFFHCLNCPQSNRPGYKSSLNLDFLQFLQSISTLDFLSMLLWVCTQNTNYNFCIHLLEMKIDRSFQMLAEGFLSCTDLHIFNSPFRAGTLNQYSITYDFQFLISMCLNWVAERPFVLWGVIIKSIIFGFLKDIYLIIYCTPGSHCVRAPGTREGTCLNTSERDQNCPRML